ncbi:glutathione transferase GstA [Nitrogeniibacter aestuarii]|uniref:glutathione transferase GstA n=1 Tax=Nitrogeniibacter aestuarii TaxID=2815343 RepID=UPI001D122053|nr:glutathione transferase GstA [Nitrogeniibacter aestuarii]
MKLYYSPGACSQAVHIVLEECGLPYRIEKVDLVSGATESGKALADINPKKAVPVLELDDGAHLTEGPVIAQFVADSAGRLDLMPAGGSRQRYRVMEWQNFLTSEVHKAYTPLFKPQVDAASKAFFRKTLRSRYAWIDDQLAGKTHLTGDAFTAADAYLFVTASWAPMVDVDLSGLANLDAFVHRVRQRPAVRRVLAAEGLLGSQ